MTAFPMDQERFNLETSNAPQASKGPRRVLVLEDDPLILELNAHLLRGAGHEVDTAADGLAGWNALLLNRYDLLVTDHDMPHLQGLDLVQRMRERQIWTPVIIVSGAPLGGVEAYPRLRLSAILRKPFHSQELAATAARIFQGDRSPDVDARKQIRIPVAHHESVQFELERPLAVASASSKLSILIVDDDGQVRNSLAAVFESEGYTALQASDGLSALALTRTARPGLVILDLNMPGMDGWVTFQSLRKDFPELAVLVITARPHQYPEAARRGVNAFMEKPLDFSILVNAVETIMRPSVFGMGAQGKAERTKMLSHTPQR